MLSGAGAQVWPGVGAMGEQEGTGRPAEKQAQSMLPGLLICQEKTEIQIHNTEPSDFKIAASKENTYVGPTKPLEKAQGFAPVLFPPDPQCPEQRLVQSREDWGNCRGRLQPLPQTAIPRCRGAAVPTLCR